MPYPDREGGGYAVPRPVMVGAHDNADGISYGFIGNIDEVRIYNYNLSDNEIEALYNN